MRPAYLGSIRPAAFVRPAGQTVSDISTGISDITSGATDYGNPNVSSSMAGKDGGATDYGNPNVSSSMAGKGGGSADNTALYNAVAGGLNTAGSTIASIIASGDRMAIARLQNDANLQIAQMQSQANMARASGNTALAAQQAQQAQQMAMFAQLLQQRNATTNTPMYILAGLAGLGILGAIVYFVTSKPKRNPVSYNPHRRAHYRQAA